MKSDTPLGISLLIDFAFKLAFGNDKHVGPLVSLLNAILLPEFPIVEVTILNPFNLEEYQDDKLSILDIKARDARGAVYNIEMQLSSTEALPQRMTFYGCTLYSQQLGRGDSYVELSPVYVICLLDDIHWKETSSRHHRFRLHDSQTGLTLEETLEIHFLELPKYNEREVELNQATEVQRWVYLLRHAKDYETERLRELFPEPEYQLVIDTLEEINMRTDYKDIYEAREKARLDEIWRITAAERRGMAKGREEGRQEGREEGREEGRQEGKLAGRVQTYQEMLMESVSSDEELQLLTAEELSSMLLELQRRLRERPA